MNHAGRSSVRGLYVHVPFCARFCSYCAFYSVPADPGLTDRFIKALVRELELTPVAWNPQTVYFGGGTPTVLTRAQWQTLFAAFQRHGFDHVEEWTVEGNPGTLDLDLARFLHDQGVNRFSLGIQSLNDALLRRLGRAHTRAQALAAFDHLRQAGYQNINLDLMFAIPTQTLPVWHATLTEALALGSEHLSSYEVTYEEDTPLYEELHADRVSLDEDLACDMYDLLLSMAENAGLHRYEVSNFARHPGGPGAEGPDHACRHNLNYWRGGSFAGLGPGATRFLKGIRARTKPDVVQYCECLERGDPPPAESEALTPLARAGETAAFGLRMVAGWPFAAFQETTGFDLRTEWEQEIRRLVSEGFAETSPERLRLTPKGLRFADWVAEQFLR
jgi:oxygen-independent coproporphyrinogen-3 oxidase